MKKFIILCLKLFLFGCSILLLFIFVLAILQGNYSASFIILLLAFIAILCLYKFNKHSNKEIINQQKLELKTRCQHVYQEPINVEIKDNLDYEEKYLKNVLEDGKTIKEHMQEDFDNAIKRMNGMDKQKEIELNDMEKHFINELLNTLKIFGLDDPIRYERLSNKSINICYKDMQIGRIKLNGRKMWIQVLFDETKNWDVQYYDVYTLEDSTMHIDEWINYLNSIIRY